MLRGVLCDFVESARGHLFDHLLRELLGHAIEARFRQSATALRAALQQRLAHALSDLVADDETDLGDHARLDRRDGSLVARLDRLLQRLARAALNTRLAALVVARLAMKPLIDVPKPMTMPSIWNASWACPHLVASFS